MKHYRTLPDWRSGYSVGHSEFPATLRDVANIPPDEIGILNARVTELEAQLKAARAIIRRLANVLEMGGETSGPLAEADEWLLRE